MPRWVSTLGLGLVGAGLVAALGSLLSAAWLFERYRPSAPWGAAGPGSDAAGASTTWTDLHGLSLLALVVLVVAVLVVGTVAVAEEGRARRSVVVGLVSLLGLGAAIGGVLSAPLVAWDQLALGGVTVGSDVEGWRAAVFDDRVRWILVDGTAIPPGDYTVTLAFHVAAPIVSAAALAVVGLALHRSRGAR